MSDAEFLAEAVAEARKGRAEGGIPIGSVLVVDGEIVGRGHNQRVQRNSAVFHAEIDALENAGRLSHAVYERSTLYTTLTPCYMCAGAVVRARIPRIVVGENRTVQGAEDWLPTMGVEVVILESAECIDLMAEFIAAEPELWDEDHRGA
jgi:cytosine/creatinine deaminase